MHWNRKETTIDPRMITVSELEACEKEFTVVF